MQRSSQEPQSPGTCNDPTAYAPDSAYMLYVPDIAVRVNVHFMDSALGAHNLNKEQGLRFADEMIRMCNEKLRKNAKMHLPPGNNTSVVHVPWYYVLAPDPSIEGNTGVYFDQDPELYYYIHGRNTNRSSRTVVDKYAVRQDSVINIFLMPHHPDSVGRPGYKAVGTGISVSGAVKVAQVFTPDLSPLSCVGLLNHEIGHSLGLSHTWSGNDGCDDTPNHTNCWYYTDEPPCDSMVSNNMMDYNAWQEALTPCQIGRVLRGVTNLSSRTRKLLRPDWCTYDSSASFVIDDSIRWNTPRDLAGDIIINDGSVLVISCRVSLPSRATITIAPTGKLILNDCKIHNSCGEQWEGIRILTRGKESGTVEVIGKPEIENAVHAVPVNS